MRTVYGSCPDILAIAKKRTTKRYFCAPCKLTFTNAKQLSAHNQTKHFSGTTAIFTKPHLKRHPCELCEAPCAGICDYLQHLQQHFVRVQSTCPVCGCKVENVSLATHLDKHESEWFRSRDTKAEITYRSVSDLASIRGRLTGPDDEHCLACQLGVPLKDQKKTLLLHNCKTKRILQTKRALPAVNTCIENAFPALGLSYS
jgi:uncharacterized Zn-finger protein